MTISHSYHSVLVSAVRIRLHLCCLGGRSRCLSTQRRRLAHMRNLMQSLAAHVFQPSLTSYTYPTFVPWLKNSYVGGQTARWACRIDASRTTGTRECLFPK